MQKYEKCECCKKYRVADKIKKVKVVVRDPKRIEVVQWWCKQCIAKAEGKKDDSIEQEMNIQGLFNSGKIRIKK